MNISEVYDFLTPTQNDPGKNNKIKEKVRNQLGKTFYFFELDSKNG
ncbi:hypothetical protein LEP1GSC127_4009 [Leptospira kirschneri str. 200801925]|nr:hypothetical protein LEP1GSC127_4009 [Leptospira kirschneri str. 200801925]